MTPCCSKKHSYQTHRKTLIEKALASLRRGTSHSQGQCCGRTFVVRLTLDELNILGSANDDFDLEDDVRDTDLDATAVGSDEESNASEIGTLPV